MLNNQPALFNRHRNGLPRKEAGLFKPVAFKVNLRRRVGLASLWNVSHGVVSRCFSGFINLMV